MISHEIDMVNGPLLSKILRFSIPLMLTGILQLLYNVADIIVVGKFSGDASLAAVGSTGALTNLIINLFIGLSVGASVVVSQYYGAKDFENVEKAVHTSIVISLIAGFVCGLFGFFTANWWLQLMETPADVIDLSTLYLKIYFIGMPASMIYNFCSAILRAVGDTKNPLIFLAVSGFINIGLNLVLVIVAGLDVAGVAIATIASQYVSAIMTLICLIKTDSCIKFVPRKMRLYKDKLLQILKIGLPAGIQGTLFSVSNVLIQSSINSFGHIVMAGNSAAVSIEGFTYSAMNSFSHASLAFTGQNFGAQNFRRLRKVIFTCCAVVSVVGITLGCTSFIFGVSLLSVYSSGSAVIITGMIRLFVVSTTYFICGIMEVYVGGLRGLGQAVTPMIVSFIGSCVFRIIWIFTMFTWKRNIIILYSSYPISWILTTLILIICYEVALHKHIKADKCRINL